MALRAVARLRSTCGLQLRIPAQTSQDAKKVFSCFYSADSSTDEGIHAEERSEKPVTLSGRKTADALEDGVRLEESKDAQFEASLAVGVPYIRVIIGRGGMTKNRIEKTTNARIVIPPAREVKSNVNLVVKGASQESVDTALVKIKQVLQRAERNSNLEFTHFISLPLASHEGLLDELRSFKASVLNEEQKAKDYVSWFPETAGTESSNVTTVNPTDKVSKLKSSRVLDPDLEGFFSDEEYSDDENEENASPVRNITGSLFIKLETIHLTVVMLKLFTDERIKFAAEVLEGVQPKVLEILDGQELKVHLKGIECLRGTPAEARVLAMRVQDPSNGNRLQQASYAIKDAYAEAGLVAFSELRQELTLHATVMNSRSGRRIGSRPFDARKILAKYRVQDWGEHTIREAHLSQRFVYDQSGYYRCCGSFSLLPTDSQICG